MAVLGKRMFCRAMLSSSEEESIEVRSSAGPGGDESAPALFLFVLMMQPYHQP
jgi:hypothetical protein